MQILSPGLRNSKARLSGKRRRSIRHTRAVRKQLTVWLGYVEKDDAGRRYFMVLELLPVDSPQTAVKAAIMSEIRNAREKKEKGR